MNREFGIRFASKNTVVIFRFDQTIVCSWHNHWLELCTWNNKTNSNRLKSRLAFVWIKPCRKFSWREWLRLGQVTARPAHACSGYSTLRMALLRLSITISEQLLRWLELLMHRGRNRVKRCDCNEPGRSFSLPVLWAAKLQFHAELPTTGCILCYSINVYLQPPLIIQLDYHKVKWVNKLPFVLISSSKRIQRS